MYTHTNDVDATPRTRLVYSNSTFRAIAMVLDPGGTSSLPITALVARAKLRVDASERASRGESHATRRIN